MMPVAKDTADYLAANLPGGHVVGTDIFAGLLPDTPNTAICLFQTAGAKPDPIENIEYPGLQILVRAPSYSDSWTLANAVFKFLAGKINQTLNSTVYHLFEAQGSPLDAGVDSAGRAVFVLAFLVMKNMES